MEKTREPIREKEQRRLSTYAGSRFLSLSLLLAFHPASRTAAPGTLSPMLFAILRRTAGIIVVARHNHHSDLNFHA